MKTFNLCGDSFSFPSENLALLQRCTWGEGDDDIDPSPGKFSKFFKIKMQKNPKSPTRGILSKKYWPPKDFWQKSKLPPLWIFNRVHQCLTWSVSFASWTTTTSTSIDPTNIFDVVWFSNFWNLSHKLAFLLSLQKRFNWA